MKTAFSSPPAAFPTTVWDRIHCARKNGGAAVDEILARYRTPVIEFLRFLGAGVEDAEDLAQETLLALTEEGVLEKARAERGRFRSLLISIAKHRWMNLHRDRGRQKRGGGVRPAAVDPAEISESGFPGRHEERFDHLWLDQLLRLALERLRHEQPRSAEVLDLSLRDGLTYDAIALRIGLNWNQVNARIRQARRKLAELLRREVLRYSSSLEEYEDELACLARFLDGPEVSR